jgi:tetratricopeptide (TPR) repeat protein
MALSKLWAIHSNLGNTELIYKYARQAMEHADRLPPRERFYVEGNFYSPWPTADRSIEAYKKAVNSYPDHRSARQNLAFGYWMLERCDEATELIEHANEIGQINENSFWILAECYDAQGKPEKAYSTLQELLRRSPDLAGNHYDMGHHLITWGKLDNALEAFQKAESLRPGHINSAIGRWQVSMLRGNWEKADAATARILDSNEPYPRWSGLLQRAAERLYHGRSQEAWGQIEKANQSNYQPYADNLGVHSFAAHVLLEKGDISRSLVQAKKDIEERATHVAEWEGLFYAALALGKQGRLLDAEQLAEELLRKAQSPRTVIGIRLHRHLVGELAHLRGDIPQALRELQQALSLLPERGVPSQFGGVFPRHVPIWFSLAKVNHKAGEIDEAAKWFQRITESTTERLWWPIPYVRSFYFLGKIHEKRSEMEKAREYYQRFVDYWGDGDMDRERVEEARRKIAS